MTANTAVVRFESKNYHEKLFEKFFQDDFLDVVLWAEGKSISAHRCVLAAGSSVFRDMLKLVCNGNDKMPVLVLNDMKFEHLRRLVEYLYCGKTKLNASELDEFFLAVKRYKILGLNESAGASSASNVQCTMVYELSGDDTNEHNQTAKSNQDEKNSLPKRNKRKIDENQSELHSQLGSRKSIPNVSKRAHALPLPLPSPQQQQQQQINLNGLFQPVSAPASHETTATTTTTNVADPDATTKDTTPSNSKPANGDDDDDDDDDVETQNGSDQATDGSANTTNGQYKCRAIGCGKAFATSQKLTRHRKFKCAQSKVFKCNRCQKSFALRFILRKHTCSDGLANGSIASGSKTTPS